MGRGRARGGQVQLQLREGRRGSDGMRGARGGHAAPAHASRRLRQRRDKEPKLNRQRRRPHAQLRLHPAGHPPDRDLRRVALRDARPRRRHLQGSPVPGAEERRRRGGVRGERRRLAQKRVRVY